VILAELEVFHSRPVAPTRRVALGHLDLPSDPAPGFGGLLLASVVAAHMPDLDPEMFDDLDRLTVQLEHGHRIPQPRLRHRLQADRVGLLRSVHRLHGGSEALTFDFDDKGSPAQHILAAVYAAALLPLGPRTKVMALVRKAMRWAGPVDETLVAYLSGLARDRGWSAEAHQDPVGWALRVLELRPRPGTPVANGARRHMPPGRQTVQRRFRELLRQAHPDHGGDAAGAAARIAELSEARRVLLAL
jgi:hypothetical protein